MLFMDFNAEKNPTCITEILQVNVSYNNILHLPSRQKRTQNAVWDSL